MTPGLPSLEETQRKVDAAAHDLADLLETRSLRIAFAESCTAGALSAQLGRIPGISRFLLGSMVTYDVEIKSLWLGVSRSLIRKHGEVSPKIAEAMVRQLMKKTRRADVGVAITGHFGPDAPAALNGVIYVGIALREKKTLRVSVEHRTLPAWPTSELRPLRQLIASQEVFLMVRSLLIHAPHKENRFHAKSHTLTRTGQRSKR